MHRPICELEHYHEATDDVCYRPKADMVRPFELRKIEYRREPPEGNMQGRVGSGQSVKKQHTTRPKARKATTTRVSGAGLYRHRRQRQ